VDLSGLIFVALAVAWAAYLIPKALRHHDDVARGRSIDRFSHSMRVLARREPVSARTARLVETAPRAGAAPRAGSASLPAHPSVQEQVVAQRAAAHTATRRRRRVLTVLVVALAGVVGAAAAGRVAWLYVALPAALLVCWLVACRLMVRKERAWAPAEAAEPTVDAAERPDVIADADGDVVAAAEEPTSETPPADPSLWDPVPVTLPTYVAKPAARRSVRTIDLDATGVWTSGRTASDSAIAREADAAEAAERVRRRAARKDDAGGEAVGS
jgi:hypothetical protein